MKKRVNYSFKTIENGSAYEELKLLNMIPSHKQLVLGSVLNAVDMELSQVKRGLLAVYDVMEKDIDIENEQMNKVELQLKKSFKKVDHIYRKTVESRRENEVYESSKIIDNFRKSVGNLDETTNDLDATIGIILENMSKVDSRFPEKSRLLNDQVFNKQHYPLSYQLMRKKCPRVFMNDANKGAIEQSDPCKAESSSPFASDLNAALEITPTTKFKDAQIANSIEDTISLYRASKSLRQNSLIPLKSISDTFIPPSLRETRLPITSTTLETISAKDFFRTGPPSGVGDDHEN